MDWKNLFAGLTGILLGVSACPALHTEPTLQTPAFPGAQGYGMLSLGGRGGRVIFVTNLEDYNPLTETPIPGSFRAACEASGPRIIIFKAGGILELKNTLAVSQPYLTVAGQTAPGDGICLKNYCFRVDDTHDVTVRYLRSRNGDLNQDQTNSFVIANSLNVIFDHCSGSWANDEVFSVVRSHNVTVQWCFITESLNHSCHPKGDHGYGSLIRSDGNVSFHHNLYAHHATRCPRPGTYGHEPGMLLDFRNNVIYNWIQKAGYSMDDPVRMNYIGNYGKCGPSTIGRRNLFRIGPRCRIFPRGNLLHDNGTIQRDDWSFMDWNDFQFDREACKMKEPFVVTEVTTHTAEEAYEKVLAGAGATRPRRDAVDQRVAAEVKLGTGRVIDSQRDAGGWPIYQSGEPLPDTDNDGRPDSWEKTFALGPDNAADAAGDSDNDGYTNLEEYLNDSDPRRADPGVYLW